jgi:opacity protein-like surface antigen
MKQVFHRFAVGLLGLAVVAGLTGTANAGIKDGSWELGVFGPYVVFDDLAPGAELDNAFGYGVRAGWNIMKGHEIEFNGYLVPSEADITVPGFGTFNIDVDIRTLTLGYLYNWTDNDKITPFVTGGVGSTNFDPEAGSDEDDTTFYAGGGVRFHFGGNFNVRVDGQWVRVDSDPDALNNWMVAVGVGWHVGGK